MNGQWIGAYSGTNIGSIVADLDDVGTGYAGVLFAFDNDLGQPRTLGFVEFPKNESRISRRVQLQHSERGTGTVFTQETLSKQLPGTHTISTSE